MVKDSVRKWATARIDCGWDKKRREREPRVYSVRSETGKRLFSLEPTAIQLRNHECNGTKAGACEIYERPLHHPCMPTWTWAYNSCRENRAVRALIPVLPTLPPPFWCSIEKGWLQLYSKKYSNGLIYWISWSKVFIIIKRTEKCEEILQLLSFFSL